MHYRSKQALLLAALALLVTTLTAVSAAAAAKPPAKPDVAAEFTSEGGVAPQFLANATTIPHWNFQYTDPTNGVTYPITVVGANPASRTSTTVHTVVVPLKLNFVAGGQNTTVLNDIGYAGFRATPLAHTFDGSSRAQDVLNSPVFKDAFTTPSDMGADRAQVGDAFMRSQVKRIGSGTT